MQENVQCIEEDEIDLRELWKTLMKRKSVIIVVTLLITLAAVVYAFVKQPIYEVGSNVMVGYLGQNKDGNYIDIANPAVIAKRLKIVFNVDDELKVEKFISKVSSVSINKKLKNFITIKTEAISNDEALKKNKEVVKYLQNLYQPRIDRYIVDTNNKIKDIEIKIENIDDLEKMNIQNQIKVLKTQKIVKINEEIDFYKNVKLKTLNDKILFHIKKLKEYEKAVKEIYKTTKNKRDTAVVAISSIQMVNYQNLILNSQNKVEDLKVAVAILKNQTIPNLIREKENIQDDALRKLEYKLKVELPNKKFKLKAQIEQLKYNKSSQNVQNSKVIGEFIVKDYPAKPKKKLIIIVAFITGLIFSVFLAFFLEFIGNTKEEK